MKYLIYTFFLGLSTTSCEWIHKQAPNQEDLLQEEISKIDWKNVDEAPSLTTCEEFSEESDKQQCLYDNLTALLHNKINDQVFIINDINKDTLWVALELNIDSTITVVPNTDFIEDELKKHKLDSIIKSKLDSLPKINPAIKRGIPVKTQINFPILLQK